MTAAQTIAEWATNLSPDDVPKIAPVNGLM